MTSPAMDAAGRSPATSASGTAVPEPAPRAVRVTAWLALAAQLGIVVTGALVRLTGSGLGCPTWPECMPGSYTPVLHPATRYHAAIEFGNRLLTFVVLATAVAALVASRAHARRNPGQRLLLFAAVPLVGTFAQAVVGGLSVLTGLSPWWVAAHFLLSAAIIAATQIYVVKVTSGTPSSETGAVALPLRWLVVGASAVLLLGTAVTGAGPHAGDADVTQRFPWHPLLATALHSSAAWALLVGVVVCVRRTSALPAADLRRLTSRRLLVLLIAQAAVGYAQTLLDLPALLVGLHVALAVLTWSGAVRLVAVAARESRPA